MMLRRGPICNNCSPRRKVKSQKWVVGSFEMWRSLRGLLKCPRPNGWPRLGLRKHCEGFINRVAECLNGGRAAPKASASQKFNSDAAVSEWDQYSGNQLDLYCSSYRPVSGGCIKIDEWRGIAVSKPWTDLGIAGRIHDKLLGCTEPS